MTDPMPAIYDALGWPDKLRPVVLPNVPGFYITAHEYHDVFQLHEDGTWSKGGWGVPDERVRYDCGGSLTHMRPVAEVAAEVLAAVEAVAVPGTNAWGQSVLTIKTGVFKRLAERWEPK